MRFKKTGEKVLSRGLLIGLVLWWIAPRIAVAVGPSIAIDNTSDTVSIVSAATTETIEFGATTDLQALRLRPAGEYSIVILRWHKQKLDLLVYTDTASLLKKITVAAAQGQQHFSVVKLDNTHGVRVRGIRLNSRGQPTTLITRRYKIRPKKKSVITLKQRHNSRIAYPEEILQQDNDTAGLAYLNWERQSAGVLPVSRREVLDEKCALHAEYMRLNNEITHYEDPTKAGYTEDGYEAGTESNLDGQYNTSMMNGVDILTTAIYHRLPMIRTNLHHIGWALSEPSSTGLHYGCLNVYAAEAWDVTYASLQIDKNDVTAYDPDNHEPIPYPGVGQDHIPIDFITGETPDPISDFGGTFPTGYPISLTFAYGEKIEKASMKLLKPNGMRVDGYFRAPNDQDDPNRVYQGNTITLIPKEPLRYATTYTVNVSAQRNGKAYKKRWQFTTESIDENYPWDLTSYRTGEALTGLFFHDK